MPWEPEDERLARLFDKQFEKQVSRSKGEIEPRCAGCGLIQGIGWMDKYGEVTETDPAPYEDFIFKDDVPFCTDDCVEHYEENRGEWAKWPNVYIYVRGE